MIKKELIETIETLGNQLEIITKLIENIYFSIRKEIGIYGLGNNINYIRQHIANINLRYTEFHTWIFENWKI